MSTFCMPSLGSDMERATLIEWLIQPGVRVKRGDIIAVVETDKGAIEIEVFENGVLEKYLAEIGSDVPVGGPLAQISGDHREPAVVASQAPAADTPAAAAIAPAPAIAAPVAEQIPLASAAPVARVAAQPADAAGQRASPAARRLAAERQLGLSGLAGSGPDGAIVLADVERALAGAAPRAPAAATSRRTGVDLEAMRGAIAAAMARSKREIPHYYLKHQIDLSNAVQWLARANVARAPAERILMGALFLKAAALALRDFPELNGFYQNDAFCHSPAIHLGTAIAIRGGGLVAPALHDADQASLGELMARWRDLVARVRAGRFRASELSDPTVTVSSLGERGVEELFAVIYPPQVACIGFGKVVDRPWSMPDGAVTTCAIVTTTLAADHRVSDGHRGARFLAAMGNLLQTPERL